MRTVGMVNGKRTFGVTDAPLKKGDTVSFTCNGSDRGGHYHVTATVTKVNRKTFDATERERSYRQGTQWNIRIDDDSLTLELSY